ncbi:MAG: MBL fold metallo-hydrolase [Syntrophaceae bacterium]|nr:MBL fold metallo-hydrolase [Syntrophaceae bacterium]
MITKFDVTVIVNNFVSRSGFTGEHGLSLLLEFEEHNSRRQILWDTGQTADVLLGNLKSLQKDLNNLETVILSHGHYDHTGGLLRLMDYSPKPFKIVASPLTWGERFAGAAELRSIGSGLTAELLRQRGSQVVEASKPYFITDQIVLSGPVEQTEPCEENHSFSRSLGNSVVVDKFEDDMSLAINIDSKGMFIITGCCHAGIINTTRHLQKVTGLEKIYGILGGLHLINANPERILRTRDFLRSLSCDFLAPLHCSGLYETCYLRQELGVSVKFVGVGETVNII